MCPFLAYGDRERYIESRVNELRSGFLQPSFQQSFSARHKTLRWSRCQIQK